MTTTKLITPPAVEPVSLDVAKAHLRVDDTYDDALIGNLIVSARRHLENICNRAFCTQTWAVVMDSWPFSDVIYLPKAPLQAIDSITYYDTEDATVILADTEYEVDAISEPGRIVLAVGKSWPCTNLRQSNGVEIRYTAGYGVADDVPQEIKQAMLLLIGQWYEIREPIITSGAVNILPFTIDALITPYRVWI